MNHRQDHRADSSSHRQFADLIQTLQNPTLRLHDVPGMESLAAQLVLDPSDRHLQELFGKTVQQQHAQSLLSSNPFWGNYPSQGQLPALTRGRIPLCALPIGGVLSKSARPFSNLLACGPTGYGKTTLLRLIASSLVLSGAIVVVFSPKADFAECELLCRSGLPLYVLNYQETPIALFQPVQGQRLPDFIQIRTELIAKHLHLEASRRLLLESLHALFSRSRTGGLAPTLSELLDFLSMIRADALSRRGQYKEALTHGLMQIRFSVGDSLDVARSNFLEQILGQGSAPACYVINTSGLMAEMAALFASLFIDYAFESRGLHVGAGAGASEPTIAFILDDSIPVLRGGHTSEAEGSGANPVATWAWLGRSRGVHLISAVQSYSVVSPAFKANTPTVICCGAYGRDAEELSRDLNLTREQAAMLPLLQPGWVVAIDRATWPWPMLGRVPDVH